MGQNDQEKRETHRHTQWLESFSYLLKMMFCPNRWQIKDYRFLPKAPPISQGASTRRASHVLHNQKRALFILEGRRGSREGPQPWLSGALGYKAGQAPSAPRKSDRAWGRGRSFAKRWGEGKGSSSVSCPSANKLQIWHVRIHWDNRKMYWITIIRMRK